MSDVARIVVVLLLVLGNAVFVAAEYSLITARRTRLEERAENGSRAARTALRLMDEPVRFITTVQVGITVFGIALGAIGEPLVSRYFDFLPRGVAFVISFAVLTYLSVTLGELVPKAVALQKAEAIALVLAGPARRLLAGVRAGRLGAAALGERRAPPVRVKPAPGGDDRASPATTSASRSRRPRTSARSRRPRRRCSTRSSTSPTRRPRT